MTATSSPATAESVISLQLVLQPDPRLLRVVRLVASGLASLGEFDLDAVEEVRVASDELVSTLIEASGGGNVTVTFELASDSLCVDGTTTLPASGELSVDPLTDRILDAVTSNHAWTTTNGQVHGHLEREFTFPS
ncbi:MAG: hypothetical protein Q8K58_13210 [Acidimicrobiales bacterium]|nr:hypothetical protein [Acidimicrobiales bacterium]